MKTLALLLMHILTTLAQCVGPGGAIAIIAESVLLKHQQLIAHRHSILKPDSRNATISRYCENEAICSQRSCRRPYPTPNPARITCANQHSMLQLETASTMNDTDRKRLPCTNWYKNMSKRSLRKLRLKPGHGYPILLKMNSRPFLSAVF